MSFLRAPLKLGWGTVQYDFDDRIHGKCRDGSDFSIKASAEQVARWLLKGEYIQNVFPELSPDDREILISGTSPKAFAAMFPAEEE